MLKIILLGIIVAASAGAGCVFSDGVYARKKLLCEWINGAKCVRSAMLYEKAPMPIALKNSGGGVHFTKCAEILEEYPCMKTSEVCEHAFLRAGVYVENTDKQMFSNYISTVASAISPEDAAGAAASFIDKLEAELEIINRDKLSKAKIARTMCIAAGVTVAIVLV